MSDTQHRAIRTIEHKSRLNNPGRVIDTSLIDNVDPRLLDAYESGRRVEVTNTQTGETRRGHVGCSTGWTPVLLLVKRAYCSSDTLNPSDKVVAIQHGNTYRAV